MPIPVRNVRLNPAQVQAHDLPDIQNLPADKQERKINEIRKGGEIKANFPILPESRTCQDVIWLLLFVLTAIGVMGAGIYFFENISAQVSASATEEHMQKFEDYKPLFNIFFSACVISCVASVFAAFVYVLLAHRQPACVVYTSLFFGPVFSIVIGLGMIYFSMQIPDGTVMALIGCVFIFLGLCQAFCVFFCWRHLIPFMIKLTQTVADVIEDHPCMMVIAVIGAGLSIVWTIVSCIAFGGFYLEYQEMIGQSKYTKYATYGAFTLVYLWGGMVAMNVCHVTYCGVFGRWYYKNGSHFDDEDEKRRPLLPSLTVAMTKSLGSICLGSLLVAIVRAVEAIVRMMRSDAAEEGNQILCVILCILECFISCIGDILEYFNEWAYIQCALRGVGFCDAVRITYSMITCANVQYIISDLLLNSLVSLGAMICGLVGAGAGAGAGFFLKGNDEKLGLMPVYVSAFMGFLTGLMAGSAALSIISSGVKTILVCWAEDPEPLRESHPEIHEEFEKKISQKMNGAD